MNRFLRFARKNVGRIVGTVVGGPALGAIVGGGAEVAVETAGTAAPVDTLEGALCGLIVAVLAVVKQYKTYQKAQETFS
jgi:hypothetical protein